MSNIYKKLHEIQVAIKGLSKDKESHNFKYVTGNKILSIVKPLMDSKGLILKQEVLSIENERQDYQVFDKYSKTMKDKAEILSKVMMKFTWIDIETGEKDDNLFGANGQNDWEKGLGSALTYGERYFLLKYFHIPTDQDDIDNPVRKQKTESKNIGDDLDLFKAIKEAKSIDDLISIYNTNKPRITKNIELLNELGSAKKRFDL